VTFVGRDVTGEAEAPYENYPTSKSVIHAKNTLYNIDRVGHTAIVVEGITDVWKIGDGAVATMGTKWTKSQARQLMGLKAAFVMFDAEKEAQEQAHRLAATLTSGVRKVEVLELSEGDPDDLPLSTVQALRREIFGR
jgi:DNA primase